MAERLGLARIGHVCLSTPRGFDAILQVGTNLANGAVAAEAERWLNKPVLAMNVIAYWDALRRFGIEDRVYGCGRIIATVDLAQHLPQLRRLHLRDRKRRCTLEADEAHDVEPRLGRLSTYDLVTFRLMQRKHCDALRTEFSQRDHCHRRTHRHAGARRGLSARHRRRRRRR